MRAAALLVVLLLAGCLSGDRAERNDPEAPAAGAAPDAPPPAASDGAPSESAAATAEAAADAERDAEDAPYVVPVRVEGRLGVGLAGCLDGIEAAFCVAPPSPSLDSEMPKVKDGLVSFRLVLTWEAASATSREMTLTMATCNATSCDPVSVTGTSPLVLEVPDAQMRGNARLHVGPAAVAGVSFHDGTPFLVEGELVAMDTFGRSGFAGHDYRA